MNTGDYKMLYRLLVGNLIIVAIVFAVAAAVSYESLNRHYMAEVEAYQYRLAGIAEQLVERVWPLPDAEMDRLCKQFAADPSCGPVRPAPRPGEDLPLRLTVVAADGRVLGDSSTDPASMENHKTPDRPEVLAALQGRCGQHTRRSETLTVPYRYVAMPIQHGGAVVAAARVAMPVVAISEAQHVIRDTLIWATVTAVVAFGLVGLLVNWVWYSTAKRAARGPREETE